MEEIKRQVFKAQSRLNWERFLSIVGWSLFATLLVGAIGLAVPKIWVVPVDAQVWFWSWAGGSLALGLVIAIVWTYLARRSDVEAAIEIDRRFGLKERVSSSLSLTPEELKSEAGQALLHDASRRIETLEIAKQFRARPTGRTALPLIPLTAMVVLAFMGNAVSDNTTNASQGALIEKAVKQTEAEVKKAILRKEKEAAAKGLKDAEQFFKQLREAAKDEFGKKDKVDQKQAMIKLNDLAKELQKKQDELGGSAKLQEQMQKLKDVEQGPADKAAKAMKDGNFEKAQEELNKLKDKLAKGELTKEERAQLAKQLEQVQQALNEAAAKHEQAKQDLQEQIKQAEAAGDREKAGQLQQKLDQMKNADKAMEKMQHMADKLGQAAEQAKNGDPQAAAEALDQLAQEMKAMQQDMDNLQMVDEMMNEVAQAKDGLCEKCAGEGELAREDEQFGQIPGKGKGKQRGRTWNQGPDNDGQPDEKNDSGKYDSKVGAKPQQGEAVRVGDADGPNMAGRTLEEVQAELNSATAEEDDPLTNQRLPRSQKDHAKQYFEKLREGE
jgi:hypothetical protein